MAIFLRENPTFGQQALTEQISKINHMISIAFNLDTMTIHGIPAMQQITIDIHVETILAVERSQPTEQFVAQT